MATTDRSDNTPSAQPFSELHPDNAGQPQPTAIDDSAAAMQRLRIPFDVGTATTQEQVTTDHQ